MKEFKVMLNISHISDTHGRKIAPNKETDLVIVSGDCETTHVKNLTPGYKRAGIEDAEFVPTSWASWNFRKVDVEKEAAEQEAQHVNHFIPFLKKRGIDLKNVIAIPGNHTFCDLTKIYPNAIKKGAKTIMWRGIKIGLLTGVLPLAYEWFDEITEYDFRQRILKLDRDINILISHTPPYGILDGYYGTHIGSQELTTAIFGSKLAELESYFTNLWLHCFGHSHEAHGQKQFSSEKGYDIIFSNAATTKNRINLDIPDKYFRV